MFQYMYKYTRLALIAIFIAMQCFFVPLSASVSSPKLVPQMTSEDIALLSPEEFEKQQEEILKEMTPEQMKELEEVKKQYCIQINELFGPLLRKIQDPRIRIKLLEGCY